MVNCGAPIWEDYCPNKECHGETKAFLASVRMEAKRAEELKLAKDAALATVQKMRAEIDRLRPMSQSNSMQDYGRRQMLDHFEKVLNDSGR
jgi:hypothetical protein